MPPKRRVWRNGRVPQRVPHWSSEPTGSQAGDHGEGFILLGSRRLPLLRPRLPRLFGHRLDRRCEALRRSDEFSRVRPREEGGPCIKKRTVLKFLSGCLGMNLAQHVVNFAGPGCDVQLVVLQARSEARQASTLDLGIRKMWEVWQQLRQQGLQGRCCGIVLCAGTHRVRTRLQFPVTIQGPQDLGASLATAEWTIAGEYLGLKSVKVTPPDCIRLNLFHTLLKIRVGNLWIKDCEFEAKSRVGKVGAHCIKVHKAARVMMEHCSFRASDRAAVDVRSHQVSIMECQFKDCIAAIDSWFYCFHVFLCVVLPFI